MSNHNPDGPTLDETFALYFSDYEENDHKRVTVDGVQTLTIKDQDAYNARINEQNVEMDARAAQRDADLAAYEQHQIDQDER